MLMDIIQKRLGRGISKSVNKKMEFFSYKKY
jgi:hypothetical protein